MAKKSVYWVQSVPRGNFKNKRRNKMYKISLICVAMLGILTLVGSGCATTKVAPANGIVQNLTAERNDYVVMSTVTGTAKAYKIVGIPFPWFKPRAVVPGPRPVSGAGILGVSGLMSEKVIGMATHDAIGKIPDADTIIPLTYTVEKNGFPIIYRIWTADVKGKAIRIKTDADLDK